MDIQTINDLKRITDFYIDLYGKCKELMISCEYFKEPDDAKAKKIISKWTFFRAVNYSFELALVIELCKLFQKNNDTQKYNINKFVNVLINNHKCLEYKDTLTLEIIKKWQSKLNSLETLECIEYAINIRDQYYAHRDKIDQYFLDWIDLNFMKIKYLLSILEGILIDVYASVYDCDLFLDSNLINSRSIVNIILERNDYLKKFGDIK